MSAIYYQKKKNFSVKRSLQFSWSANQWSTYNIDSWRNLELDSTIEYVFQILKIPDVCP